MMFILAICANYYCCPECGNCYLIESPPAENKSPDTCPEDPCFIEEYYNEPPTCKEEKKVCPCPRYI